MTFTNLLQKFNEQVATVSDRIASQATEALSKWLSEHLEVRLVVASGVDMDRQASSIIVLDRLIELGCSKINIVYEKEASSNLEILIPGFKAGTNAPAGTQYSGAQLTFTETDFKAPLTNNMFLGITGDIDLIEGMQPNTLFNVEYFLELNPFEKNLGKEGAINALWYQGTRTLLNTVPGLGKQHFDNLAFKQIVPKVEPALESLKSENLKKRVQALLAINPKNVNFLPTDGLLYPSPTGRTAFTFMPDQLLATLCGAISLMQSYVPKSGEPKPEEYGRPTIVVLVGDPQASVLQTFPQLCQFAAAHDDWPAEVLAEKSEIKIFTNKIRTEIFENIRRSIANKTRLQFSFTKDSDDLSNKLKALKPGDILFVSLLPLPPAVLNNLLQMATLPYILNGQGSANIALNLGKPFLKMANQAFNTEAIEDIIYHFPMMPPDMGEVHQKMALATLSLCGTVGNLSLDEKLNAIVSVFEDQFSRDSNLSKYFTLLRLLYQEKSNRCDKLTLALRYLLALRSPPTSPPNNKPLDALFANLQEHVSKGTLALCPGAFTADDSPIAAALDSLAGSQAKVNGVSITRPNANSIQVTGRMAMTVSPIDDQITLTFSFDNTTQSIVMAMTLTGKDFSFDGVPWFTVKTPEITLTFSQDGLQTLGRLSGTLAIGSTNVPVSADFPTPDGISIVLDAPFDQHAPSWQGLFQLLGGINPVATLPNRLDELAGLSMHGVSFAYDFSNNAISYFTVRLQTTPAWELLGSLTLQTINFSFTVQNPTGSRAVSWTADSQVTIASGHFDVGLTYPNLTITASMADDSPSVPLSEVVKAFASSMPVPVSGDLMGFGMSVVPGPPTDYSVTLSVSANWKLPSESLPIFELEGLNFIIDGQDTKTTARVSGQMGFFPEDNDLKFYLPMTASYNNSGKRWIFSGTQHSNISVIQLLKTYLPAQLPTAQIPDFFITSFSAEIQTGDEETGDNAYYVLGGTIMFTVPFLEGVQLTGVGHFANVRSGGKNNLSAKISTTFDWNNIPLVLGYNYDPDADNCSYTLSWGNLQGNVKEKDGHWMGSLTFSDVVTLGEIVETFVFWATGYKFRLSSPWNLLDGIVLGKPELTYDFTEGTVSVNLPINSIELGFAKIKSIDLTYRPNADPQKADKEVEVTVTGSFRWLRTSQDDQTLSWYATDPTSTPAPPGQGNEFLELRLLAMGQHVEVKDLVAANNLSATSNLGATIQHAIGTFTRLPPTSGETKPAVDFSPGNSWLIGTDFGLLKYSEKEGKPEYACTLQFVFNDPELYALRIALAGPPAKILDGLDFGILYRKISDTVGVYELELTLPNSIRTIECGVYTIQLPVIGVCIYTNGDFQLDIGFPWKIDFSRSFTVQAIVYPGIPLMGSGGFYFGKLPGTISNSVPQATNGTFDPVIVFGFGAQLGLGKSLSLGPLQLHFSVTVLSIIEGVLARWNPNPPKEPDEPTPSVETTPSQMDGTYYYRISGTFGVAAIVNGVIDFAVVRAAVNLSLVVTAQIVFAAYEPIAFTVEAVVDVSASIKIKVKRLFSITIRFHFSQDLTTTFTIQPWRNVSAPWQLATPATGRLGAPLRERLTALRRMDGLCNQLTPKWDSLAAKKPATSGVALNAYLTYALTAAGDAATRLNQQLPCYIATLVLDAPQPESPSGTGTANTSFDELCKLVTRWVVAAFTGPATLDDIDERLLCDDTIDCILLHLQDTTSNPQPIPADALLTMLAQQVTMTLWDPNFKDKKEIIGAFFPMPPELSLNVKAYEGAPAYNYTFSDYNTLSEAGVSNLRSYFDQLALQVDKESPAKRLKLTPTALSAGSVASFVFTDYFLLVARQCLTALRTGLRDYKWPLPLPGDAQPTPQSIVDAMNNAGNLAAISKMFTLADLFTANASAALATGSILTIANAKVLAQATDSFASIAAQARFGSTFTAIDLARANQENSTLLQPGQSITINGHSTVTQTGDTLSVIASRLRSAPDAFLTSITGISNLLFMPFSAIALPAFPYTTQPGDTLAIAAAANGITVADLAAVPANGAIAGLFDPSTSRHLDVPHVARLPLSMLLAEAQDTGAFSTLSGMISRYHLHGLRLPTSDITANSPGMWVAKPGDPLPSMAGLYALTGQQFPVPPLAQNAPFTVTLGLSDSQWIAFENGGSTIDFSVSAGDEDGKAVEDLRAWIHSNHLDTDVTSLGLASRIDRRPASFGLGASIRWDSSTLPSLPFGAPQAGAQFTRIAPFPASMANVLARNSHAVPPAFTPIVQSYDEASKRTVSTDIVNYGWATTLAFSVKQVPKTAGATVPCTYEVLGAGAADVALLEDVVAQLQGEKKIEIAGIWLGLAPPPSLQASGGIQTALDASFGIGQANLSTQTNPPERMKMAGPQALNGNAAFLTLLWEASITASGGFYLYYSVNGKGLPDHVFNSDGIATLTLVIVYAANNQLGDYTNALVFTDPVDNSAAISIQAVPQPTSDNQLDSQGIAELAAAHYTDLVDVARDNATTTLKSGAVLAINGGTYMVSPQGAPPGGNVTDIAAHFETAAAAIQAANPRIPDESWQGSLPAYTALRLPPLTITVGTSPGGTTLQSLVAYYGIDAVSILVDNQDVGGLFATPVSLAGGPVTATSSLPPDSQFYRLQRPVPADSDSPKELLLNNFSLLGYRVDGITPDFVTSNLGVPVGPTGGGGQGVGKMRRPRQQRVGDSWIYDVALSYGTLVTGGAEGHPYQGIGRLLQVDFQWLDLYGNTIISDLTSSITDSGGSDRSDNRLPTLTGYTDDIVALSQWPSASASWSVMKKDRVMEDKLPQLTIVMNFDPSRYQTDTSDAHRDPVANATADLQVYGMLQKQFGDSAGMMVSVETSLATAPLAITGANREGFDNFRNSIVSFLTAVKNREQGTPPGEVTLSLPLSSINQAQVIELACAVTIARQAGIVEGEFSARPGIRSRTTTIGPKGAASGLKDFASELEGAFADNSGVPLLKVMTGPNRFDNDAASATSLWAVRIGPYGSKAPIQYSIKNTDEDPKPAATIFAPAPLSTSLVSRRQVALCPFESYDLSNPVKGGINWSAATDQQNFIDIDLDTWAAKLFAAVDELLTPEYISALVILDNRTGGDNLARLQANKSALADRYAKQMQAVFEATNKPCGDTAPKEVVELFRQTLLGQLGNAYNTQAAVHFPAKVEANIAETPPPDAPPRLYGQVVPPDAAVKKPVISVTNARLPLTTLKDTPFVFLVTTSAPKTSSASVQLALEYRPSHIEHQIAKVPGIEAPSQGNPYMASSWLQFVNPPPSSGQRGSLSADLGSIDMPMVLRAYPTSPILSKQAWKATDPLSTDLTTATQWNYCATYFLPLHSPQDTVHVSVAFNVDTSTSPHATIMGQDCFDYAAQFITTYPKVRQELVEALARIDDNTTDFTVAQHAMDDVNKMLEQLRDSIPHEKTLVRTSKPPGATSTTGLTSVFTIREMADSCGRLVVEVAVQDGLPPAIEITGWQTTKTLPSQQLPPGVLRFSYQDVKTGKWLNFADAQSIGDRTITFSELQIMQAQDAIATVHVSRNDNLVKGRTTCDAFVYRTPNITFPNSLQPNLISTAPIDIGAKRKASLEDHLNTLFTTLVSDPAQQPVNVQLECYYTYTLGTNVKSLPIPIGRPCAMQVPTRMSWSDTPSEGSTPRVQMVANFAGAIITWFNKALPSGANGRLHFSLTIMPSETKTKTMPSQTAKKKQKPLLTLTDLTLSLANILPTKGLPVFTK